jgi:DNA-binding NarL/FixJ family response regulator
LVVEAMLHSPRRREASALARLSDRERQVLEQMAAGRSNTAIGEALYLSVSAVEKHISAIFTKLGLVEERASHRRVAAVLAYLSDR